MIPNKLKISGIWWTVIEVDESEIDCDNHVIGDQSPSTQIIRIAKTLTPEMKWNTLIHEILHCIDGQLDHDLVEMLANGLYQVLSENELLSGESRNPPKE